MSWRTGRRAAQLPLRYGNRGPAISLLLLLGVFFLWPGPTTAQVKQTRRVLILNELGQWSPAINAVDQEIFEALQNSPYQIELYTESLDTNLFPDEASQRHFRESYFRKYQDRKLDLIIAVGPSPMKFMSESHKTFSPQTPIVFWGSTEESAEVEELDPDFTGVWGVAQPEKTLDVAMHLQRDARHVVVVGGVAPYDRYVESLVRQRFQSYRSKLDFTYLTDLAMPDLLDRLQKLPANTIIYYTSIMQDGAGTHFVGAIQSLPMVASAANAPVYVMDDVDVGRGTVGGDVQSFALAGKGAAEIAGRILNGEKPQNIPIVREMNVYMFDWRALKRWGLKESDLPPGSVILNRQPTFWEAYKRYLITAILVFLAQTLLIIWLLIERAKRKKTEGELLRSTDRLRLAMESGKAVGWEWDVVSGENSWFGDVRTLFRIPSETFTGKIKDFFDYVYPEDRRRVARALAESGKHRKPFNDTFRVVHSDGATRWFASRGKFEYARDGSARRMLGMAVDVTESMRTEEALKSSEEKFSKAFRQSPLALTLTSANDHRYIEVNDTFEQATGWTREEVIGRTPFDIAIWVDPSKRTELANRLLAEGSVRNLEASFRARSGQIRTGLASAELIEINGEPCILSVIADITEARQAEEARRTSDDRFRQFFATLPEFCFMTSPDGVFLDANPAACKALGYTKDELIGKPLAYIYAPESHAKLASLFETWRREGQLHNAELVIISKQGQKRTVLVNVGSVKDADGKLLNSTSILIDITESKHIQEKLRESEGRFRLVANAAPVMIWMSGPDKLCTYFNETWLEFTGRSHQQESGNGWANGVHADDLQLCMATYENAFDRREPFHMEYRLRRRDGEYRWVFDQGVPRFDPDGSFAGYIGSAFDVTELRLAQEALSGMSQKLIEAHEQERAWIARELHDDINQRIALLAINLEGLDQTLQATDPGINLRLAEMSRQVSDLGGDVQALSHHLHSSKLEYLGITAAASSYCRELSARHGVEVDSSFDGIPQKLPEEIALCLFRILQEALQNAVKHSGSKHFEVSMRGSLACIELSVRDSGIGFDVDDAIRGGHGLGLISMKERLKLVHGELSIDAQPRRGTLIRATVPLGSAAKVAQA
jgi:PAS domain S-box-containing protein